MKQALFIAAALAVIGSAGLYGYKTSLEWKAEAVTAAHEADAKHCRDMAALVATYGRDRLPEMARIADECRNPL